MEDNQLEDGLMSLTDHLEELRKRIIYAALAILVPTAIAFFFSDFLLGLLVYPSGGLQLKAFGLMDGFMIKWTISLVAGIVVAFPVWAYQVYQYVSPGLLDSERRAIFPPLVGAAFLFILGAVFGYYMLSGMIRVLIQLFPKDVQFLPAADEYISFVLFFMLACGMAFQLPTLIMILARLHLVDSTLLRKQRRYAYFILFVFAEVITPVSDPIVAPLTVLVPLVLLYEMSVALVRRLEVRRAREVAKLPSGS